MKRWLGPVYLLLLPANLWADGKADLSAALKRLSPTSQIRLSCTSEFTRRHLDVKPPAELRASFNLQLEESGEGVRITYGSDAIERIRHDADREASGSSPTQEALQTVANLRDVADILDASRSLLSTLERAILVSDGEGSHDGERLRHLVFNLPNDLPESKRKYVKVFTSTLSVWVDGSGLPRASVYERTFKAKHMFISFEGRVHEDRTYALRDGRLTIRDQVLEREDIGLNVHESSKIVRKTGP